MYIQRVLPAAGKDALRARGASVEAFRSASFLAWAGSVTLWPFTRWRWNRRRQVLSVLCGFCLVCVMRVVCVVCTIGRVCESLSLFRVCESLFYRKRTHSIVREHIL